MYRLVLLDVTARTHTALLSGLFLLSQYVLGAASYNIQTVAGSNFAGDDGPAVLALLNHVEGIAIDGQGNLYIADTIDNRVRCVSTGGTIRTIAGTGTAGFSGDGGLAIAAQLNAPYGLAVDRSGNVYIADLGNARIRKITADGRIDTIAGGGDPAAGAFADGGAATMAVLVSPRNLALDTAGNVYFSDFGGQKVYEILAKGTMLTIAGTGIAGLSSDGGSATQARLNFPAAIAIDRQGNVYIGDSENRRIRRVSGGVITTVGDTGRAGADSSLNVRGPTGMAFDSQGDLWIADSGSGQLLHLNMFGAITALPTSARDIAFDSSGNLYLADGPFVRKMTPTGVSFTVAGSGVTSFAGDGGSATIARLNYPSAVTHDSAGNLFFADQGNHRIRKISVDGMVTTVAGNGQPGFSGDGSAAILAQLNSPTAVAVDAKGSLYITDTANHRVRKVTAGGFIYTIAGKGTRGYSGDGSSATAAQIDSPDYVVVGNDGTVYFSDNGNSRVREISVAGTISTLAGNGLISTLDPRGLTLDTSNTLYIADTANSRIRKVAGIGTMVTAFDGKNGLLRAPRGVAIDSHGVLFVADSGSHQVKTIDRDGTVAVIAGDGSPQLAGDGSAAATAELNTPLDVTLDDAGNIWIADSGNNRIRKLTLGADVVTPPPPVQSIGVTNAASLLPGAIAPGEIISIFGSGIGPQIGVGAQLATAQTLAMTIGDTQVLFNGTPGALLYAQARQINVQVPYEIAGLASVDIQIFYANVAKAKFTVGVTGCAPAIFPVALNEDGRLNSDVNPAARGGILIFFATGEGLTDPDGVDGKLASAPYARPLLPVTVRVGANDAEVLYAGAAPGFAGLMQVNVRLPGGFSPSGPLPVTLRVGTVVSPAVTVTVR